MNSKHSAKTQQTVIDRIMKENVPVGIIVEETGIPRSTIYRTKYRSEYEFKTAVENYIEFYNNKRPHKNNKYKTPQRREYDYFNNNTDI